MKIVLLLFMVVGLGSATLDLKRSITRIQRQIDVTNQPGRIANWTHLPEIIGAALPCLNGISMFKVDSDQLPMNLIQYIEHISPAQFAQELLKVNWVEVSAKRSDIKEGLKEKLEKFMQTDEFVTIHNQIWGHVEFLDLVGYMHDANYPEIYNVTKAFYTAFGRKDLADKLPTAPPTYPTMQAARRVTRSSKTSSHNFPIITMKSGIFKEEDPKCDLNQILKLLDILNKSNIQEIIKVFLYALQEVIGNAAMHVLLLKIGEPQKGEFFHDTLALPEMEEFLPLVQELILNEPGIAQLNNILRQVTGLTIGNIDLFKYIVNLIQYLVWNYPFPEA